MTSGDTPGAWSSPAVPASPVESDPSLEPVQPAVPIPAPLVQFAGPPATPPSAPAEIPPSPAPTTGRPAGAIPIQPVASAVESPTVVAAPPQPAAEVVYLAQPYAVYPVHPGQAQPAQPYSAVPYSAVPYSAVPYSAVPYSAMPYSAQPYPGGANQPVSAYPYGPYQANPWAPLPLPTPRRSGLATRWVVGILAMVLMVGVVGLGVTVGIADYTGALDTKVQWRDAEVPSNEPPAANATSAEWVSWARRSLADIFDSQAKALLAGDEVGYLAPVDPADTSLVDEHKRRYKVLHAMGPGKWTQAVTGSLENKGARSWNAGLKISYCFGTAECEAVDVVEKTTWTFKDDRLVMVDLTESPSQWNGPRPWETDDLTVLAGQRVIMAATKSQAWRLTEAVKAADKAAGVADTFAKWAPAPNKYLVFLAGPEDWKRWYGPGQPEWAAAWAVPVGGNVSEVVVRTEVVQQRGLETLLTHELTHVTTLGGKANGVNVGSWWLIEGIADYATMVGKKVNTYDSMAPTRTFVRNGWNGDPSVPPPGASASLADASGRYGVAFLAIRSIAEKYGQDKMLDFFGRMVHDNDTLDVASRAALGQPWATVSADCASFVRSAVG